MATLDFRELYRFGDRAPELTDRARDLAGKRGTLVGFMVLLENPVHGGFYLSPYPAISDESGAGRGGVPPTAVLVLLSAAGTRPIDFVPGALEVSGTFELGTAEKAGEISSVRLIVDDARGIRFARTRTTLKVPAPRG
ncbi:MAG TPA: hypothetical protein VFQ61_38985 [Polyangiaceae bacterium]|nr:hypothetical protein [Polyangiaceae bacterium]